ncbi:MAG: four helix bundle protein [Verrucomicrobiota bacterium]
MAGIQKFEEIEAWQKGRDLTRQIYRLTAKGQFARDFTLQDQMKRAAISITSNIAEGFERGGNREFIQFLAIAKGSASEVKSQLYTALDAGYLTQSEFDELYRQTHSIVLLLGGFIKYLRKSELRGQKFKTVANKINPEP